MHCFRCGRPGRAPQSASGGFTLGELMIALALVAILAALALPNYTAQQRQGRRADARQALLQVQLEQARWRGQYDQHADQLSHLGWPHDRSALGHYRIAIEAASSTGYTLTATGLGAQSEDKACNPMRLQLQDSASIVLSSGVSLQSDPAGCWRP